MACGLAACGDKNDEPDPTGNIEPRTVLVYMVANNNLAANALADIHEMEIAADNGALGSHGRLLLFKNAASGNSLVEIVKGAQPIVLKTYPPSTEGEAVTVEMMREVFADMKNLAPAHDYGLVLWSHGTGWMDDDRARSPQLRSFGDDGGGSKGYKMKVTSLREALDGQGFEWIYFDCCHMGTVEVLYELRDCARVFAASPTELPGDGMRYDHNLPVFFAKEVDLAKAAANTFDYYNKYGPYCTMTVVESARLDDLARATRRVMEEAQPLADDYEGIKFMRRQVSPVCTIFDMKDYIAALGASAPVYEAWERAYDNAITYSAATPTVFNLDMTNYSGLGCNIMFNPIDSALYGYNTYQWYDDVAKHLNTND